MLSTSFEYRLLAQEGAPAKVKATLTLADGTVRNLVGDDFVSGNLTFSHGTSSTGSFDLGAAITGAFNCTLNNFDRRFDEYDFTGAKIEPFVGFELQDGSVEWLRKGTYWVEQPSAYSATIGLSCFDSMVKFDVPFSEIVVTYPVQASTLLDDIANYCGIPLLYRGFANNDLVLYEPDKEDMTCRDALSYIAQATGNYARITNEDKLEVSWYDPSVFEEEDWLDGGEYDDGNPYQSGDVADGGNFLDYSSGYVADGGSFDNGKIVNIFAYNSASVMTDDVVITGISVTACDEVVEEGTGRDGETVFLGAKGYVLLIEDNPFITFGRARVAAEAISNQVIGLKFRPFDVACLGDPRVEPGDAAIITDRYQNAHRGYLTNVTYKIGAYAAYSCDAEAPLRMSSGNSSAATKAFKDLKNKIKKEQTARENAVKKLNDDLANSSGMYSTKQIESDRSVTYLLHDKPTIGQSEFVWKINAAGLGISVNGGNSYQFGIDKWGSAILNSIYAIGINADYITTGALRVRNASGNTIFCADVRTREFWWSTQNSSLSNNGFLTITGGKIGGFTIANKELYSQSMNLSEDGLSFRTPKGSVGKVIRGTLADREKRGLSFYLDYEDGWYIAWSCQKSRNGDHELVMLYSNWNDSTFTKWQMHFLTDLNMHWYTIRNSYLNNVDIKNVDITSATINNATLTANSKFNYGVSGTINFVKINSVNKQGEIMSFTSGCKMSFKNGVLTSYTW